MKNKRLQIIWRYGLVSVVVTLLAVLIVTSIVRTTIVHADKWNHKADSLLNRVVNVQPKRGDILACDGSVLATNLTVYNICIDYRTNARYEEKFMAALDSLCDSLATYYPVRTKKQWIDHLGRPLQAPPSTRTQCHIILKDVNYSDYLRILRFPFFEKYKSRYKHGLYYDTHDKRVMPYGTMARRSIGWCSTKRVAKFIGDNSSRDSVTVMYGYAGLECALDTLLYGTPGTAKSVQLTHGVRWWIDQPAIDGNDVKTTIDINMQDIVENELHDMLKTTRAKWGTCILMEVETGDIKAISNLDRDDKTGEYVEAMYYALQAFEPGSVMKPISMLVALEGKFDDINKYYQIGSTYAYAGGSPIHDTHSPASLQVKRFIEYSSNIGMTKLIAPHYENNLNGFRDKLAELGFFDKFNTGMANERTPYFPRLDPKAGGRVSLSRMAYGYSTMIPPLYTCAFYNAIANDGKFVRPRIVKEVIHPSGDVEVRPVSYVRDSICSVENARILREMIYGVVYGEGGTAKSLRNNTVTVVGKTGTCRIANEVNKNDTTPDGKQKPVAKGYKEGHYRLAFCGFYPYDDPKYTCMVLISDPAPEYKSAASTSGTVLKNIALKMYARGMLDNYSDITPEYNADPTPLLYAVDPSVEHSIQKVTGRAPRHFSRPANPVPGRTPDVRGLTMREAIARIEDAGYNVKVKGAGYASTQSPAPGTAIKEGATVTINFTP